MQLTLARGDGLVWTGANTTTDVGRTILCEITAIYLCIPDRDIVKLFVPLVVYNPDRVASSIGYLR